MSDKDKVISSGPIEHPDSSETGQGLPGYLGSSEGLQVIKEPPLRACAQPGGLSTTFGCICPSLSSTLEVCTNRFCWGHQCPPVSGRYTSSQASPEDCNALTQRRSPSQQNPSLERRLMRETGADLLGTCRPLPCTPGAGIALVFTTALLLGFSSSLEAQSSCSPKAFLPGKETQLQQRCPAPSACLGFGPAAEKQEAPGRVAMAVESGRRLRERAPGGDEGRPGVRTVAEDAPIPASGSGGGAGTRCLGGIGSTAERAWCPGSAPRRGTRVFCPRAHPTPT
ncbi:uncharacterized protein LOC122707709 [Cervus elaphus]|uniref:uncharacterized protein LOC122707709 n=1 Tax=Cervus elaphus TaxID=9860 RepID=UPI001CC2A00E|nr:uncharacterized protein LOC122707709 [Cervus elaphus]